MFGNQYGSIDSANPLNWEHPDAQGLKFCSYCIPGVNYGGAKMRDFCSPADLSLGNHGTLTSMDPMGVASGWNPTNRVGGRGEMRFAAVSNNAVVGSTRAIINGGPFCVTAWTKLASTGNYQPIATKATSGTNNQGYWLAWMTTGPRVLIGTGLATKDLSATSAAIANVWKHVVGQYTGSAVKIYVDGSLVASSAYSSDWSDASTQANQIGKDLSIASYLDGAMDAIRIYNRVLSADQVRAVYLNDLAGNPGLFNRVGQRTWFLMQPPGPPPILPPSAVIINLPQQFAYVQPSSVKLASVQKQSLQFKRVQQQDLEFTQR